VNKTLVCLRFLDISTSLLMEMLTQIILGFSLGVGISVLILKSQILRIGLGDMTEMLMANSIILILSLRWGHTVNIDRKLKDQLKLINKEI
jgi:hypothetical protein